MVKKTQNKLDNNEFDFDAEFGGDFDFDLPDPTVKDDRKPAIKIKEGFKEGVKDTLQSREFAISSAKKLFPTGYGQAYDEADRIGQTFKNLYDESAEAIRPAIKQAKQIATRLVPADAKYLPPMLQKVLKKWDDDAKSESGAPGNVEGNNREALLSANLNDLFKAQTVQGHQDRVQDKADSDLQRGVESIRHKSVLEVLNRTSLAVTSLDNYQRNIGVNYQKQSLTLQYRQLFALEDIRSDYAKDAQKRDSILLAISKNTSLPEYAKIRDSEARKQAVKNKFYDSIAQGLYGGRNQYIEKTLAGIKKNVGGAIKNSAQGFMSGLTELSMMIDMTDGAGIDPLHMAGNVAGSGAATGLGHALAKRLGKGLVGSKLDKMWNISGKGHQLAAGVDNLPNWLNEFRKSGKYAWGDTLKDKGLSVLQGLLPSMAPDTQTEIGRGGDMNAPFHLTRRTDRSINEIIPGFLSRILRELQIVRSGNNKIPLIEYDHDKNSFARTDSVVKSILTKTVPAQAVATTQARLNGIMSMVDPRNELDPKVQEAIKKRLLFNSADNNMASRDRLAEENQYSGAAPEVAKAAATHMTDYFNWAGEEKLKNFQMAHNQLSRDIADPRAHIQQEIDLGRLQHLSKLGLVNAKTGQIDLAKILSMYLDEKNGLNKPDDKRFAELSPNLNDGPQGEFVGPQEPALRKIARRLKETASSVTGAYENRDELIKKGKRKVKKASVRARRVGRDVTEFAQDQVAEAGQDLHNLRDQVYNALEEHPKLQEAFLASEQQAQKAGDYVGQAYNTLKKKGKRAIVRDRKASQGLFTQAEPLRGNGPIEEDLYVGTEEEPRIKAIRIPAGGYYIKSTGVVVDRYDQLTDDVYDWDTNKIVVSKSELAQLHTLDAKTGKIQSIAQASAAVAKAVTAAVKDTKITRETFSQAGVKGLAKGMVDTFKTELADQLDAPTGVKVEGEEAERISLAEMKEGSCIDVETNTPITRPSQIEGEVKNKLGQIVIRMEDLPKLRFFNVRIGKYTPLWFAGKLLKKALHWQLVGAPKMAARNLVRLGRFYKNAGTAVVKGVLWLAGVRPGNQPEDLYLPGQLNPIIIGKIMANGGYFSVGLGGRILKPVLRPADITGELRDENGQVVLTNEQFKQGLYNIKGRKVSKSLIGKLIKSTLALPFKVAGKIISMPAKAAWEATKLAARGSGALLGGLGKGIAKTAGGLARGAGWLAGIRYEGSQEEREELLKKRRMSSGQRVDLVDPEVAETPTEPTTIKEAAEEVKQEIAEAPKGPERDAKGRFVKKADADKDVVETKIPGATLDKLEAKDSGKLRDIKRKTGMSREEAERIRQLKDSDILAEEASEEIKERKAKKLRAGSYEDKLARAKDTAKQLTTKDGIKGLVQQAKDKASAATKGYGLHELVEDAEGAKDAAKGVWKGAKAGGSWLARHAKSLLGLGKGAAGLAAGAEGLSALGGLGGAGAAAAGTAAAVEGTAVAGAAAAAGGGTLLASLGAGALAVIGSPITISLLAAGLLGYGLYKGIKYLRKGHLSEIGQLRCVQYGFAADDTSHARAIVNFEAAMIPLVKAGSADGKLTIDEAKIQLKDCLKIFDLEPGNQLHIQSFIAWYNNRFKPVFLTHESAIKGLTGKTDLDAADDLKAEDKKKYLDAVAFASGPYNVAILPIADLKSVKATTADDVKKAVAACFDALGKVGSRVAKTATAVAGALTGSTAAKAAGAPGQNDPTKAAAQTVKQQAEALRTAPLIDRQTLASASPDAEAPVKAEVGVPAIQGGTTTASGLVLAAGDMSEGRNANAFVRLGRNVKLDGMNSQMKTQLMGLIEEYGNLTGKATTINDGYRSYEDQAALYRSNPSKAAKPGSSMHEYGLAVDINQGTLNEMDKLGLLRKYGFIRPVGKEPWHMEPIGTQANLEAYKKDQQAAATAILNGAGKGGGGWGTEREATPNSRNLKLTQSIMEASVAETDPKQSSKLKGGFEAPVTQPAVSFGNFADRTKVGTTDAPANTNSIKSARWQANASQNAVIGNAKTALASANDAEYQVKKPSAPLSSIGNTDADPSAQVPDPQGSGLNGVRDTILGAAKLVGVDGNLMLQTAAVESDFNPNASPGNTSAQGLFQDTRATWEELINKYGKKYGYTLQNTSPTDVKASAILNAHFLKDNLEALGRESARPLNAADAYALHLLGRTGGQKFLSAMAQNPSGIGAELFASAAKSNPNLFYKNGQALTLTDVYANLSDVIRKKSQAYGLSTGTIQVAAASETKLPPKPSNGAMIGAGQPISPSAMPISTRGRPSSMAPAIIGAGTAPMMQPPSSYLPPAYAAAPTQNPVQPQHVLDSKAFTKSEDLLSKQLDIQIVIKDTLIDLAKAIKDNHDNQKTADSSAPTDSSPSNNQTFQAPTPRVSMKRHKFG